MRTGPVAVAMVLLVVLLSACKPGGIRREADPALMAAQEAREATLAQRPAWHLVGRIAVSVDGDGGSGRIEWQQWGEYFDIRLSAPVSRQSWRLSGGPGHARLEGVEQGPVEGRDAQALLYETTGWLIPLEDMAHWVRGVRGQGPALLSFDAVGLPAVMEQGGWAIDFRDWFPDAEPALPRRVFAERPDARVRLQVDRWQAPTASPHHGD